MVAPPAGQVRGDSVRGRAVSDWDGSGLLDRMVLSHGQIFPSGRWLLGIIARGVRRDTCPGLDETDHVELGSRFTEHASTR